MAIELKICCDYFILTKENVKQLSLKKYYTCPVCRKKKNIKEIQTVFDFAKFMFSKDETLAEESLKEFLK